MRPAAPDVAGPPENTRRAGWRRWVLGVTVAAVSAALLIPMLGREIDRSAARRLQAV